LKDLVRYMIVQNHALNVFAIKIKLYIFYLVKFEHIIFRPAISQNVRP